jgi:phenylalanyl-tRNA synthetase beta chain
MQLTATAAPGGDGEGGDNAAAGAVLHVSVPVTRPDVLHEIDVVEDVAIAYGYNNIARVLPATPCPGAQQPINRLTDALRGELARAGYDECLTFALVSRDDNCGRMGLPDDGTTAVVLANPQTEEFQVGRTALVPGLLKSLASNRAVSVRDGLKLFEVSDVLLLDAAADTGASNVRHAGALYAGPTAGFEVVHGLVDRLMALLEVPRRPFAWAVGAGGAVGLGGGESGAGVGAAVGSAVASAEVGAADAAGSAGVGAGAVAAAAAGPAPVYGRGGLRYWVEPEEGVPSYFPGRAARLVLERAAGANGSGGATAAAMRVTAGTFGVLHPRVLAAFELGFPVSVLELNVEHFL